MLRKLGIIKSKTKSSNVFETICPDFINTTSCASEYVKECWDKYLSLNLPSNNSLNNSVFELITATLFVKEGLTPLFLQAKVAFVPNVKYDTLFYTAETGPISVSIKTSLRERYKQADLEAVALKYVHRKAQSYLISIDEKEAADVQEKIEKGDALGLNKSIFALSPEFDEFINEMKNKKFIIPEKIDIIVAEKTIT